MAPQGAMLAEHLFVMLLLADSMTSVAECSKSPPDGSSRSDMDVAKSNGHKVGELNELLRLLDSLQDVKDMLVKLGLELNDIHQQQNALEDGLYKMSQRLLGGAADQGQDVVSQSSKLIPDERASSMNTSPKQLSDSTSEHSQGHSESGLECSTLESKIHDKYTENAQQKHHQLSHEKWRQ